MHEGNNKVTTTVTTYPITGSIPEDQDHEIIVVQ